MTLMLMDGWRLVAGRRDCHRKAPRLMNLAAIPMEVGSLHVQALLVHITHRIDTHDHRIHHTPIRQTAPHVVTARWRHTVMVAANRLG